jgi:hypothetical protein
MELDPRIKTIVIIVIILFVVSGIPIGMVIKLLSFMKQFKFL